MRNELVMMCFRKKLDDSTNQFHIIYDDFKQKINVIKHETNEGITNLQTELDNEIKPNTAGKKKQELMNRLAS